MDIVRSKNFTASRAWGAKDIANMNDFTQADGKPCYFRHELQVYGRAGQPCYRCGAPIQSKVIGQRNTF